MKPDKFLNDINKAIRQFVKVLKETERFLKTLEKSK
jgi:hypothetical protein